MKCTISSWLIQLNLHVSRPIHTERKRLLILSFLFDVFRFLFRFRSEWMGPYSFSFRSHKESSQYPFHFSSFIQKTLMIHLLSEWCTVRTLMSGADCGFPMGAPNFLCTVLRWNEDTSQEQGNSYMNSIDNEYLTLILSPDLDLSFWVLISYQHTDTLWYRAAVAVNSVSSAADWGLKMSHLISVHDL